MKVTALVLSIIAGFVCKRICSEKIGSKLAPGIVSVVALYAYLGEENGPIHRCVSRLFAHWRKNDSHSSDDVNAPQPLADGPQKKGGSDSD